MRYWKESRFVVKNVMLRSRTAGKGVFASVKRGDRKIQSPVPSATSNSAPFAHKSESSRSSRRIFSFPESALASSSRCMVSRLVREASLTVASMLRRKPMSLIQKKTANDDAKTTQYSAVRRARMVTLNLSLKLLPNTQILDVSESILSAVRRPVCVAATG